MWLKTRMGSLIAPVAQRQSNWLLTNGSGFRNSPGAQIFISRGGVRVTYKAHNLVPRVRLPPAQLDLAMIKGVSKANDI